MVESLIVNKEQRVPDIAYFDGGRPDPASTADTLIVHGQEYHTSFWGHTGLLGIRNNILVPAVRGLRQHAAASLYPNNAAIADLAHAQGGLVRLRASLRRRAGPGRRHEAAAPRVPDRRGARQGRLLRGARLRGRLLADAEGLVPAAQLRLPDPGGGGHRRDGELRVAARAGRPEPRVREVGRARAREVAGGAQGRPHVRDERPAARVLARRARSSATRSSSRRPARSRRA